MVPPVSRGNTWYVVWLLVSASQRLPEAQAVSSYCPIELSSGKRLFPLKVIALLPVVPHVQKPPQCVSIQLGVCSLPSPLRLPVWQWCLHAQ
eukprot:10366250-Heterocapsa_arctica.AAC.1